VSPRADFHIFLWGGAKLSGGVVMIMCRGGSRVFDDRFIRFTQLLGGSGGMPPRKKFKIWENFQHFLRSGVTFKINLMIRKCMFLNEFFTSTQLKQ
jgi:hypothetical protein